MGFVPPNPDIPDLKISAEDLEKAKDAPRVRKYSKKYRLAEEKRAEEMRKQAAGEKRNKRAARLAKFRKFLFDILKTIVNAVIGGLIALAFEHRAGIFDFIHNLFS